MTKKMSNFDLKVKFDTAFDKIFFSKEFRNAMVKKFGICPNGMTFDTRYDDDVSEIYFVLVSKSYGYEYSGFYAKIDSIASYFEANMDLLKEDICEALFYQNEQIFTKIRDEVPTPLLIRQQPRSAAVTGQQTFLRTQHEQMLLARLL